MFQLDVAEPLEHEIRRVALGEIKDADHALADGDEPLAVRVHEARKRLKRLRALLALLDGSTEAKVIARVATSARAAASILAAPREHAALLQSFDALAHASPSFESAGLRSKLEVRAQSVSLEPAYLEHARERLRDARQAAKDLSLASDGFSAIANGFRKTYRKARGALTLAREKGSASNFHAFRKPSKRSW
jgi:hypothetical protein